MQSARLFCILIGELSKPFNSHSRNSANCGGSARRSNGFHDHDLEFPANPIRGTRLVWKIPSQSLVRDILRNPFYAGAYVWGRRPVEALLIEGRLRKRQ